MMVSHSHRSFLTTCLLILAGLSLNAQEPVPAAGSSSPILHSKWITYNKEHRLVYTPDSNGNRIPDFSMAGYHDGNDPLPAYPTVITLTPSGGDDTRQILDALDEIGKRLADARGIRGAILLKKGNYSVSSTIEVRTSGVIIAGEGNGEEGTVIRYTATRQSSLFHVRGTGKIERMGTERKVRDSYTPVGSLTLRLTSVEGLSAGDPILVYRPATPEWIHAIYMDSIKDLPKDGKNWTPEEYGLNYERIIVSIDKQHQSIELNAPLVMPLDQRYGGGSIVKYSFPGRVREVGFADLRMLSTYDSATDEQHGWDAILFSQCEQSWVKKVSSVHFGYSCVHVGESSKNISILNSQCLDPISQIIGGRRYSFNIDGQLNLVKDCYARHGRHDYVTGARVCGPNVFVHCLSDSAHDDSGPHHRWATGTLFDNIVTDGTINVQDRGRLGTGHGWSGAWQVLWNCKARDAIVQNPPLARNWNIGFKGKKGGRPWVKGREEGEWEAWNMPGSLDPASLYEAQWAERRKKGQ